MASNPPPPLTIMLNEILPSKYLHKGPNPAPPLTIMLNEILPSTSFCKVSKIPAPSEHFVEWVIAFNLSSQEIKSATSSGHYVE
jgi:hypothetical protein